MKITRFHCVKILEWCEEEFGASKYNKGVLTLEFKKPTAYTEGLLGEYNSIENMIYVNSKDHENLEDLCKTILEEYYHYLESDDEYQKLYESYDYEDHPHEVAAKKFSVMNWRSCLLDLQSKYDQFQDIY
jgi:hypothetical protein